MYSYEERMRAVALYIKLGKRPRAAIRELGYPSRNALKGWYLEYERQKDFPARSARRLPKFSEAQKLRSRLRWHITPATGAAFPGQCGPWGIPAAPC